MATNEDSSAWPAQEAYRQALSELNPEGHSYRKIARLTGGGATAPTVKKVLTDSERVRWRSVEAVVRALGGDLHRYQRLWESCYGRDPDTGVLPISDVIRRLQDDNVELRGELVAVELELELAKIAEESARNAAEDARSRLEEKTLASAEIEATCLKNSELIKHLERQLKEVPSKDSQITELTAVCGELRTEIESLQDRVQELPKKDREIADLVDRSGRLGEQLAERAEQSAELQSRIHELGALIKSAEERIDELQGELAAEGDRLSSSGATTLGLQNQLDAQRRRADARGQKIKELELAEAAAAKREKQTRAEIDSLKREVERKRLKISERDDLILRLRGASAKEREAILNPKSSASTSSGPAFSWSSARSHLHRWQQKLRNEWPFALAVGGVVIVAVSLLGAFPSASGSSPATSPTAPVYGPMITPTTTRYTPYVPPTTTTHYTPYVPYLPSTSPTSATAKKPIVRPPILHNP